MEAVSYAAWFNCYSGGLKLSKEMKFKAPRDSFHALFELYSSIQKLFIFLLSVSVVSHDTDDIPSKTSLLPPAAASFFYCPIFFLI